MTPSTRIGFLALVLAAVAGAPAAQAFDLSAMGGVTVSNYSFDPNVNVDTGASFMVGGLVGHDFAPGIGLETGALYTARKIGGTVVGVSTTSTANYLDIPILLRFTGLPFLLVEAGGYVAPGLSTSGTFGGFSATGGAPKLDAGLRGVLGVRIPILPKISLRAQAQYSLGLANAVDSSTVSAKSRALDVIGGATFEL